MNKKVRWGLIAFIAIGLAGWGIYSQLPKTNEGTLTAVNLEETKKELAKIFELLNEKMKGA